MIPVRPLVDVSREDTCLQLELGDDHEDTSCVDDDASTDPFVRGKERKKEREMEEVLRKQQTLKLIRNLTGMMAAASMLLFDASSSLVLSQFILLSYFAFAVQASSIVLTYTHIHKAESDLIEPEKHRCGVIWRGYFVAVVLSIAVDSMSMASWFVLHTFVTAERSPTVGLILAVIFMTGRITVNGLGLVAASKVLHDFGQVGGGIFVLLIGKVLNLSKRIGDGLFLSQAPMWTAFEGRGIRLGSRTRNT
jgi:hypothetical protein